MNLLENKNILVAVTGSIAIYKSLELIRLYKKAGANVRVVMTKNAQKFIQPLAFETISQNRVLIENSEDWTTQTEYNHIAIGKWADIMVIAPCTANTINKLSNGIADNLLLQTALAFPKIKLLAPAANTHMIQNPFTKASLKMLKLCNYKILGTTTKELACRDIGDGAMAEVEDIFHATVHELLKDSFWSDRKVVLNGGGTIEKVDDVRYISNQSSGKMANALALALYYRGADVCLITSSQLSTPKAIYTLRVQSAEEMFTYCQDAIRIAKKGKMSDATLMDDSKMQLIQKKPFFFGVAAVSDYRPEFPQEGKLKKEHLGDHWSLELVKNRDILKSIDKEGIYTIGFKAELDPTMALENATQMLNQKSLDGVCLNLIEKNNDFGSDTNSLEVIISHKNYTIKEGSKLQVALELLEILKENMSE